jgi:NAD-dependent deacetylase
LPERVYNQAASAAEKAQLFFTVGTSAEVYPAAFLPSLAKQNGSYVVEINVERTSSADYADELLIGKSGEILPEILLYLTG